MVLFTGAFCSYLHGEHEHSEMKSLPILHPAAFTMHFYSLFFKTSKAGKVEKSTISVAEFSHSPLQWKFFAFHRETVQAFLPFAPATPDNDDCNILNETGDNWIKAHIQLISPPSAVSTQHHNVLLINLCFNRHLLAP